MSRRDQTRTIFGQTFNSPFGISPTGGAGLFRWHADQMLATAARDANIPYIMSGASNDSIETCSKIAGRNHWYQLYAARDPAINLMVARELFTIWDRSAEMVETFVFTDLPAIHDIIEPTTYLQAPQMSYPRLLALMLRANGVNMPIPQGDQPDVSV